MGSQTLEILRQGVWASLTGGWFYDPHQNLFCNTVHLYVWLFLLCLPFSIYLYFPPASLGWIIYCALVAVLFAGLKLLNHGLHHMYDTTECIIVQPPSDPNATENTAPDEGMEMQMLKLGGAPATGSDNESVTSLEYHKPNNSTIDLKVDVHRKNSSESSMEDSAMSAKQTEAVAATKSDLCVAQAADMPGPSKTRPATRSRSKSGHRRERTSKRRTHGTRIDELIGEASRSNRVENNLPVHMLVDEGPFAKVSRRYHECPHRRGSSNKDFFKEWLYLDGSEAAGEPYQSKFARQLSSDSRDNSEPSVGPPSPKKRTAHRRRYANYPDESCTKSAMALATQQSSNMRRNSNSTMSTIQLPLLNSTAQLVSHMRRHSNNADTGFFASVELGEYMMVKAEAPAGETEKSKGKSSGFRRIKSAALEIGCPPPSVSNLSPHPNSAETIGGQMLKNPKSAVIPPPSKSLTRGPHLNLYPKNESGEGCSYPYLTYGSEIVYPIAEISDEMQTSQKETDLDSSGESYSDYDDEKQFRGFDWDAEQSPAMRSSDSDYENNGSRSPLLDRPSDVRVVRSKTHGDSKKHCCERHTNKHSLDCPNDKSKPVRLKKLPKHEPQYEAKRSDRAAPPCCECKTTINTNVDYFEKASASSKDLLIEKSSLESNEAQEQPEKQPEDKKVAEKKPWDHNICNSSSSSDTYVEGVAKIFKPEKITAPETEESQLTCDSSRSADERSVYSLDWLFEESDLAAGCSKDAGACALSEDVLNQKLANALGESSSNVPKNLGAIPKQIKNLARSRASSQKENKKRDSKKEKDENQNEEVSFDAVEAQAALVQGLECLFAATNANTVVMPPTNRDERQRSHRQSIRGERENSHKTRKRSIEEVAQTSTNTLLPTSMPLLAAFLNSRVDFGPCCAPAHAAATAEPAPPQNAQAAEEAPRFRPLMDRNHRNRIRKIKRSTRQRNNPSHQNNANKRNKQPAADSSSNSNNVHFATSFDDTTDGAIHCFMDEYGNWMSYTFDKNSSGRAQAQPIPLPEKEDGMRINRVKPIDNPDNSQETAGEGSCGSLESEAGNSESIPKTKRGDSIDQSSSNQGSNNPLLSSNNNVSAVVPINTNNANKRFYVFDGGTGAHADQPRSPVAYVTDSLLEQIEAERQSRMGLPSMHINFLMNQQRAQQMAQQQAENTYANIPSLMPSIGEESVEINLRSKFSKLIDEMEKANQPKPKSYYKFKLSKCFELKVTMDRLQLMALFDRNLTFKETFVTIFLAVMVAVLGSMVLNLGFYRDIYAFWFCFIMAGSQYSLLKSVQPDSASPVHGFNKMVVFSRPVYFCICTALLCGVHSYLEQTAPFTDEDHTRRKRSVDVTKPITIYGFEMNERDFLLIIQEILSKFLLFFPLAFSLGLFPQVNTFLMYFLEQIDMHVFGGNATSSLSAAVYCVVRSVAAIGVLYGFAYSGLVEGKKSQHQKHNILFSIFCGLLVPIAYHLSRSASDYTLIWNLIKKHLLPPELYVIHTPECSPETDKSDPNTLTEDKKNNSESNISKQNSIGSSASKINFSSETNIAKQKRSQTSSVSSLKMDPRGGDTMNSTNSLKGDVPTEDDKTQDASTTNVKADSEKPDEDMEDPLPKKLQATVNARLKNDVIVCTFLGLFVFGLHCTTVFTTLRPQLNTVLWIIAGCLGWALHYVVPQLRKQQPWLCLAGPVLKQHEHAQFEVTEPARLMCFEKMFVYLSFLERNVLYPAVVVAATSQDAPAIATKYGDAVGALIICVCALKCLRNAYSEPESQYLILVFAVLLFQRDLSSRKISETFLVDYFITAIIFSKVYEFLLKVQFVVTYIAPWQITWGSAFHAFAQPFSVPHSAMLFLQAAVSALLSSPLTPALGSAIFMTSYVRPVKFWERDYNTKRVDQSNTRLSSQLERNLGADDNNLNSIFYEHLTRSLQHYLCGDLMLGRWGQVQQGDCFVLASDYLNCLVHIVEMGNGLVSFQLRGLEFRGTYCQQREVEAISEGPEESSEGVCGGAWWCGGRALSLGAMWALRWLAWQLVAARYVLEGYSVSDNSAVSMLQVFEFRKVLLTYYVKSIIYYTIQSAKLEEWLSSPMIAEALKPMNERNFVDLDPIFNVNLDEDYDFRASGITRSRFCAVYGEWIAYCGARRGAGWRRRGGAAGGGGAGPGAALTTLCFALSLLGRRALAAAQHLSASSVEFFLYGLHSLFKGDFRITCARDEWVFTDMSLLHSVLAPAIRMALKLHQDHFMFPEEYCSSSALYCAIASHSQRLVICHEAAPAWRYNVLRGAPHLLALRHVMDEGNDDYKIIMLNKRHLGFRVIKLNRECVRGLWAGQQQELVYLRNRNPERGSIQNAKQALRNIINSSCDQPIGYPIYVSPLTTSYADTSPQLCELLGGPLTVSAIRQRLAAAWRRIRRRCGEGCSSGGAGGAGGACDAAAAEAGAARGTTPRHNALHLSRTSLAGTRGSLASAGKPTSSTLASLAGLLRDHAHDRPQDRPHDDAASGVAGVAGAGVAAGGAGAEPGGRGLRDTARRERGRARTPGKDSARQSGARMRRAAPASFRLLGATDGARLEPACSSQPNDDTQSAAGSNWECAWRDQPRRAASAKVSSSRGGPSAESSLEDLTLTPTGLDLSLPDCKIIANRNARQDRDFKRYYVNEMTPKDLSKLSKEIRHERESYRELTGRYIEKPEAIPLKETHYSDLSNKESILKKEAKKEPKAKEIKTKIKRSDSGRSSLKANVSVGSKVLIVEPLGVYDCINLGRRIDVLWPSDAHRDRGGRNYWGAWVPLAGMDGLVVHKWTPNHRDPKLRSHVDKSILLIQIDDKFVPIAENCVQDLGDEV
ncbi:pecanex-like protein 1 isoform X4 [Spodoptera frugiperda]|uniref:Pecanex-like protein n=1 Tax=Spodoptera frugiperda TaxID=7108 RepID=A0A9R0ETG6_SPOFR|nr:pecanex-like protein 1 isoform X4 [Spodoptera frugiperda]